MLGWLIQGLTAEQDSKDMCHLCGNRPLSALAFLVVTGMAHWPGVEFHMSLGSFQCLNALSPWSCDS